MVIILLSTLKKERKKKEKKKEKWKANFEFLRGKRVIVEGHYFTALLSFSKAPCSANYNKEKRKRGVAERSPSKWDSQGRFSEPESGAKNPLLDRQRIHLSRLKSSLFSFTPHFSIVSKTIRIPFPTLSILFFLNWLKNLISYYDEIIYPIKFKYSI